MECDFRKCQKEIINKPKTFVELSLGLEERLNYWHLKVLYDFRKTNVDLAEVKKKSAAAFGLAQWLTRLADFSHYTGLMQKAKNVPIKKLKFQQQP